MIQIDLPSGQASPLVRGFAACLSSVTEVPVAELPELEDLPVAHALASWKSWLAGRGFGIVPIADAGAFQWAGWWIAIVDRSDSSLADGPQRQVAVLAFGTPPGVVLSPQDPALLVRATAGLEISSAYAVASLDPVLPPVQQGAALTGVVELLAIAPLAEAPMQLIARAPRNRRPWPRRRPLRHPRWDVQSSQRAQARLRPNLDRRRSRRGAHGDRCSARLR